MTPIYDTAKYNLIYIYGIDDETHRGLVKIGKTSFSSRQSIAQLKPNCSELKQKADQRIQQQTRTALIDYKLLHTELAVKTITMQDGSNQIQGFDDHDVHNVLFNSNFRSKKFLESGKQSEWFEVDLDIAKQAIKFVKEGKNSLLDSSKILKTDPCEIILRDEQKNNVEKTIEVFKTRNEMLWNCKMRYGKTVTAYELIKRQGYKKVIVITHRPAVEDSWYSDHRKMFVESENIFIDRARNSTDKVDDKIDYQNERKLNQLVEEGTSFIYFASLQDLRGSKQVGGKYDKNNAVFNIDWDLLIIDEAHEGTLTDLGDSVIKGIRKVNTKILLLSGTPYNILNNFQENQFTWTYVDEQRSKDNWDKEHPDVKNPYAELPKMNIYTFDITDKIKNSYRYVTEELAFNFTEFFRTWTGNKERDFREIPEGSNEGDFVHASAVFDFLTLISEDAEDSKYPFSNDEYREMFAHTFWIVPGVKEAKALSKMIKNHPNFKEFDIVNIAGEGDEESPYEKALALVRSHIKNYSKTITISCGKLTTGITVKEWTGIMMLAGSSKTSAQSYMQAIFRVQSPGFINGKQKRNCYVFDFAPDRTLRVISEVHDITSRSEESDEQKRKILGEFINFCPIIAVKDTNMQQYNVSEMMRQLKRISIDTAINNGFSDDSIYISNSASNLTDNDTKILSQLSDAVYPMKKGSKEITINNLGLTNEEYKRIEKIRHKPKKELTLDEKRLIELYKQQREEQIKLFNLLRAISIRLPLLFYGAEEDITTIIKIEDFIKIVDDESWIEFMPKGLRKELFLKILKFYDRDVVTAAGLRIRQLAKAADELPPTLRVQRIIDIISKFRNPDKETVLTPWRVVNMHMGTTLGGYNFYDKQFQTEIEQPRLIEQQNVTEELFLNVNSKILEMNSKSGLYPLYLAYSYYRFNLLCEENDATFEEAQNTWLDILKRHVFVLCKTKMARTITIRTLVGYSGEHVNAICLSKLVEERMKEVSRLSNKLRNPCTWGLEGEKMNFDAVVGNPPYQGNNHQQIYPYFYLSAREISSKYVSLIFPIGWQQPKSGNNLSKMNVPDVKRDKQIVRIDNRQHVFPEITGVDWVNIILWKRGYDNGLNGNQLIYKNGLDPTKVELPIDFDTLNKPKQIQQLFEYVQKRGSFISLQTNTSVLKPYGLRTDVFVNLDKYNLPKMQEERLLDTDIRILGAKKIMYVPKDYPLPKKTQAIDKYKVFVPYAWGGMSSNTDAGLGGPYSNIFVASPNDICTETYLESGCFDLLEDAIKHAKYLMTKFARALLFLNKISQHSTRAWGAVPVQDYTESWWDNSIAEIDRELFKKYNVPLNIENYVMSNLQIKKEENIIEI